MAYTQIEGSIVIVCKHTFVQVLPWMARQSCMHMGKCAKGGIGVRAHKAMLYKLVDKLGKIKQAMHNVLHALYLSYCLSSSLISPFASTASHGLTAILAKVERKSRLFKRECFWYALNCVEPLLR